MTEYTRRPEYCDAIQIPPYPLNTPEAIQEVWNWIEMIAENAENEDPITIEIDKYTGLITVCSDGDQVIVAYLGMVLLTYKDYGSKETRISVLSKESFDVDYISVSELSKELGVN